MSTTPLRSVSPPHSVADGKPIIMNDKPALSLDSDEKKDTTGSRISLDRRQSNIKLSIAALAAVARVLNQSDDNDLSPPPSTISSVSSSIAGDAVEENATQNEKAPSQHPNEDEEMADVEQQKINVEEDQKVDAMQDVRQDSNSRRGSIDHPTSINGNKRKRSVDMMEGVVAERPSPVVTASRAASDDGQKPRPKVSGSNVRGVVIGYWRHSPVPDDANKHAIIGFIDARDRLRTRIQPHTRDGRPIPPEYPLPPGPGGSWATFEQVVFDDYLVGLDQLHVKEFVKLRADAGAETEDQKRAADAAATQEAKIRVRSRPPPDAHMPSAQQIAHGIDLPDRLATAVAAKRRRTSTGLGSNQSVSAANTPTHGSATPLPPPAKILPSSDVNDGFARSWAAEQGHINHLQAWDSRSSIGRRPVRILLGCWNRSSEANPANRHAVYGVLGTNDTFRVKLVRHARDGRYIDGNFPPGPGALWIQYNEVDFDPHLRNLNRDEVKEYCRVRQRQMDTGEAEDDRIDNETKAVYEAQQRVARQAAYGTHASGIAFEEGANAAPASNSQSPFMNTPRPGDGRLLTDAHAQAAGPDPYGPTPSVADLAANRRLEPRPARHSMSGDLVPRSAQTNSQYPQFAPAPASHALLPPLPPQHAQANGRPTSTNAPSALDRDLIDKTGDLARREVARHSVVQSRNDQRQAARDAANAAANAAAQEAAAAIAIEQQQLLAPQQPNRHHSWAAGSGGHYAESENVQALQKIWQQKEAHRLKHGATATTSNEVGAAAAPMPLADAKIYAGVRYERKTTGPFAGRLISQGALINIDGEDYVEYRVLTKPSFF